MTVYNYDADKYNNGAIRGDLKELSPQIVFKLSDFYNQLNLFLFFSVYTFFFFS